MVQPSWQLNFRVNQAKSDYVHFNSILLPKLLTDKQLVYLHNTVLIPKIAYRLQTTFLPASQCARISTGFKMVLKRKLGLVSSTPDYVLFLSSGYGLIHLHQHLIANNIAAFSFLLNSNSLLFSIFQF